MKLAIIGTGYVGLVAAACFSSLGHTVSCTDNDRPKLANLLGGKLPIFEPGLEELVKHNRSVGRLMFVTSVEAAIAGADCCFITLGTPSDADDGADISQVVAVARVIARRMSPELTVVVKSTVPVGTTAALAAIIRCEMRRNGRGNNQCKVAVNPEFLKEGEAIDNFLRPDRIVFGAQDEAIFDILRKVYAPLIKQGIPVIETDTCTAEMAKYAANVMLAARISQINEVALLCDRVGADVVEVTKILGLDDRIGKKYLQAGIGYGGSCLPKDVLGFIRTGQHHNITMRLASAIHEVNKAQVSYFVSLVCQRFGENLTGVKLGLWGLSFKSNTDDVREAPAIRIVRELNLRGAEVTAYDPAAADKFANAVGSLGEKVIMPPDQYETVFGKDGLLLLTEWPEFIKADFPKVYRSMRTAVLFDGRNCLDPADMLNHGFEYYCIGRGYTPGGRRMMQ